MQSAESNTTVFWAIRKYSSHIKTAGSAIQHHNQQIKTKNSLTDMCTRTADKHIDTGHKYLCKYTVNEEIISCSGNGQQVPAIQPKKLRQQRKMHVSVLQSTVYSKQTQ